MKKVTSGWKAFRVDSRGRVRFLFHAHDGSSIVPFNTWIRSKARWVTDGQRQKKYRSGFHFLVETERIDKFDRLTKGKYIFLQVQVRNARPKPRTNVGSWIAQEILVPMK